MKTIRVRGLNADISIKAAQDAAAAALQSVATAASSAAAAATRALEARGYRDQAQDAADAAAEASTGFATVEATSLPPGASATAEVTGAAPTRELVLGIPRGLADDASMEAVRANAGSAFAQGLSASTVAKWRPNTAYAAGDIVAAPDGGLVQRVTAGTSGAAYTSTSWQTAPGQAAAADARVAVAIGSTLPPISHDFPATRQRSNRALAGEIVLSTGTGNAADTYIPHNANSGTYFEFGTKTPAQFRPFFSHGGTMVVTDYFGSPAVMPSISEPSLGPSQNALRVMTTSTWLLIRYNAASSGAQDKTADIRIDGIPLGDVRQTYGPGGQNVGALHIVLDGRPHLVEVFLNTGRWLSLNWDSTATCTPAPLPAGTKRVVVPGDSWTQGTLGAGPNQSFARCLQRRTSWEVLMQGQGGTGWVSGNDGSGANNFRRFGDAIRVAAMCESLPDLIVPVGSQNDHNKPGVQAAVAKFAADVKAASANTKILLIGAQQPYVVGVSSAMSAAATANASNNIIGFVDPVKDGWFFPGILDPFDSTGHPSAEGADYWGYRLEKAIRAATSRAGMFGW